MMGIPLRRLKIYADVDVAFWPTMVVARTP